MGLSTFGSVVLLPLVLGLGLVKVLLAETEGLLGTVLLYFFVFFIGLSQCYATQRKLADPNLSLLSNFWVVKFGLTIFLLYAGWVPQLDPSTSTQWGYDAQRYYQESYDLILDDWTALASLNYQGILFYYASIFFVFGYNPVVPALVNVFVTLLATLYLIRVAYELKTQRSQRDWTLAYLLLIPEVLWFDVQTSRETLTAALLLVSTLTAGRYIVRRSQISFAATLVLVIASLVGISFLRTTLVIPVVVTIVLMILLLTPKGRFDFFQKILLILAAMLFVLSGPLLQVAIGGYAFEYSDLMGSLTNIEKNVAAEMEWSGQSVGLLLAPTNFWQAILYTIPRMVLYLLAPLPYINFGATGLLSGDWLDWQNLMLVLSSGLNVFALPYALAGFAVSLRCRRILPGPLVMQLAFWISFVAIVGGNMIIHERYRVMVSLLFYMCAWFGYTSCSLRQVRVFAYPWFGFLAIFSGLYAVFKLA